jgi:hypothetical protein
LPIDVCTADGVFLNVVQGLVEIDLCFLCHECQSLSVFVSLQTGLLGRAQIMWSRKTSQESSVPIKKNEQKESKCKSFPVSVIHRT